MGVHLGLVMEIPVWRGSPVIGQLVLCLRRQR